MTARNRVLRASQHSLGFAGLLAAAVFGFAPASSAHAPQLQAQQQDAEVADNGALQLAALIEGGSGPLIVEGVSLDRAALLRIYHGRDYQPIWQGRDDAATALSNALAGAGSEGIDPQTLGADALAAALGDPTIAPAAREVLLTGVFVRYGSALAQGQIDPQATDSDWVLKRPTFDAAPLLDRIARGDSLAMVTSGMAPAQPAYKRLKGALARYSRIAASGGWAMVPDPDTAVGPRRAQAAFAILRRRLALEGLAAPDSSGDLLPAIREFQARHGIDVDSNVGPATLAALNVGAAERAGQLRLALERYREMQREWPPARLVVNIPSATLVLYRDDKPALTSRVVVGDPNHPTPILGSAIGSVLFNPPWTVPASIVRKEIQPRLLKDPGYLARNHFKLLGHGDGSSNGIDWSNTDILANGWQVQQEPGPWNALGTLMFDFPSPFSVYLHDTPGRSAFARSDRGLSHGCVRVEAVVPLAGALLGAEASPEAIQKIVAGAQSERHSLKQPMPIYLTYMTAFVDDDGKVQFRSDLYGIDAKLAAAIAKLKTPEEPRLALGARAWN
jgi:murein L,D-transpeptidase YcbB/YkuD